MNTGCHEYLSFATHIYGYIEQTNTNLTSHDCFQYYDEYVDLGPGYLTYRRIGPDRQFGSFMADDLCLRNWMFI